MFNTFWGCEERKVWWNLLGIEIFFGKIVFVKHLKSWTCISYHKNWFTNVFAENFPDFSKLLFLQNSIDQVYFLTNLKEKENSNFKAKTLRLSRFLSNSSQSVGSIFTFFFFLILVSIPFNKSKLENFQILDFWPTCLFMHCICRLVHALHCFFSF